MLYLKNFLTELAVKKELKLLRKLVFLFFLFSSYPLVFAAAVIFAFGTSHITLHWEALTTFRGERFWLPFWLSQHLLWCFSVLYPGHMLKSWTLTWLQVSCYCCQCTRSARPLHLTQVSTGCSGWDNTNFLWVRLLKKSNYLTCSDTLSPISWSSQLPGPCQLQGIHDSLVTVTFQLQCSS